MNNHRKLKILTGVSGFTAIFLYLTAISMIVAIGVDEETILKFLPDLIFPTYDQHLSSPVIYSLWMFITCQVLLVVFGTALPQLHPLRSNILQVSARLLILGALLFMVVTLLTIGLLKGMAPAVLAGERSETLKATGQTLIAFRNYGATLAGILVGVSSLGFGTSLVNEYGNRAWWAIAAGIISIPGAFWPVFEPLSYLRNAGFILFLTWVLMTGFNSLTNKT